MPTAAHRSLAALVALVLAAWASPAALAQTPWDLPDSGQEWTIAIVIAGILLVGAIVTAVVMAMRIKKKQREQQR
ncbi:MAG: hypothetical protein ACQEXJ_10750 [Myxococcota bacterium]